MKSLFVRLIALLLVPCLVVEPASAEIAQCFATVPGRPIMRALQPLWQTEALELPLTTIRASRPSRLLFSTLVILGMIIGSPLPAHGAKRHGPKPFLDKRGVSHQSIDLDVTKAASVRLQFPADMAGSVVPVLIIKKGQFRNFYRAPAVPVSVNEQVVPISSFNLPDNVSGRLVEVSAEPVLPYTPSPNPVEMDVEKVPAAPKPIRTAKLAPVAPAAQAAPITIGKPEDPASFTIDQELSNRLLRDGLKLHIHPLHPDEPYPGQINFTLKGTKGDGTTDNIFQLTFVQNEDGTWGHVAATSRDRAPQMKLAMADGGFVITMPSQDVRDLAVAAPARIEESKDDGEKHWVNKDLTAPRTLTEITTNAGWAVQVELLSATAPNAAPKQAGESWLARYGFGLLGFLLIAYYSVRKFRHRPKRNEFTYLKDTPAHENVGDAYRRSS